MNTGLIRTIFFLTPLLITGVLWIWRRPPRLQAGGALLTIGWNLPAVIFLNFLGLKLNWWSFRADGGVFIGVPVDFWLSEVMIWGAIPFLLFPSNRLFVALALGMGLDVLLVYFAEPIIQRNDHWFVGKILGLMTCLLPAQLLGGWTYEWRNLHKRATLQVVTVSGLVVLIVTMALEHTGQSWRAVQDNGLGFHFIVMLILAFSVGLGYASVQEFVIRGKGGTPIPWDPPRRLVQTGPYSYVANPMHLSLLLLFAALSLWLWNPTLGLLCVWTFFHGTVFLVWDKSAELGHRHGVEAVSVYRMSVRSWVPSWRPRIPQSAHLYILETSSLLPRLARRLMSKGTVGLQKGNYKDADYVTSPQLLYRLNDGSLEASDVTALLRAMNHLNLLWAWAGWIIGLPMIRQCFEFLVETLDRLACLSHRLNKLPH